MPFNNHQWLEGTHAKFGASTFSWLNYDEEKMIRVANKMEAARRGTQKHALAAMLIEQREKLPESEKTLNKYVNDSIGYRMTPEVILFANPFFFGTADAISFRNGELRLHDLKTGQVPGHFEQLEIYAAFYCIEYKVKPVNIDMIFRLYQNDAVLETIGDPLRVTSHMSKINLFGEILSEIREEVGSND